MSALFSLEQVSFSYGNKEVLHDVNMSLNPGKFYGLVGPNGSGKTTLLDLLIGSRKASSGTVLFKEKSLSEYNHRQLALDIALVPQEFRVNFDFTVLEVVLMGRHPHIPRFANPSENDLKIVHQVMTELGIEHLKKRLATQLSGGEKQRVIVARALAQNTPVMVLDEATSSLDIHHSIQIFHVVRKRVTENQGTIIAAIHDLNFAAAYCDEIILLKNGAIQTVGPPEEVLTSEYLLDVFGVEVNTYFDQFSGAHQVAYQY